MDDKSWAMFSLTVLQIVLGFWAGFTGHEGLAAALFSGAGLAFIATWCMTTY